MTCIFQLNKGDKHPALPHRLFLQTATHSSLSIASLQHDPKRSRRLRFNTALFSAESTCTHLSKEQNGISILPTLPSPLQQTPLLSSPGKQRAPNIASYRGISRTLSLNSLLHRKGYFRRHHQPENRVHRWHAPKNREKPRGGFCSQPGTFGPNTASSTTTCRGVMDAWRGARLLPLICTSH